MAGGEETPFTIRDATHADAAAINELCIEAYREFRAVIGEANWQRLKVTLGRSSELINEGQLIVAGDHTGILGVVLYVPGSSVASMRTLAVSPSNRGRGIGRRLAQECIDRARNDGAEEIALTTADMMSVARPMYERMGFAK